MKRIITCLGILCLFSGVAFATKYTVVTESMSFSPETITANVGDTIKFVVNSPHTAIQVSLADWESNNANPLSGGFYFGAGTNEYVIKESDMGVIYFICAAHASMGMKGSIRVNILTGINPPLAASSKLNVFPSLAKENETVSIDLAGSDFLKLKVYSITGSEVAKLDFSTSKASLPMTFGKGVFLFSITGSDKQVYLRKVLVK